MREKNFPSGKKMREKVDDSGLKIKLIEKSGRTLGDVLRTSDPRKEKRCTRNDCPVCTTDGKGNCKAMNANYQLTCECGDRYVGTTTRSAYTRGKEHMRDLRSKNEDSDFWQHCKEKHNQTVKNFKMDVIETFKGDATLRQISEAVRIERTNKRELINRKKEYRPTVSC